MVLPAAGAATVERPGRGPSARTLDRLGLINEGGGEVSPANIISADAATHQGNQLHIRVVTQGGSNVRLFEDHFRRGDVMHVYVRGYIAGINPRATNELNVVLQPDEWRGVKYWWSR